MKKQLILLFVLSTLIILFSGCATTQPSQFYLLSSLAKSDITVQEKSETATLSLGIGPITIPKYLNRPQVVTRTSNNALKISEFHQWAEQLDTNIPQVIAENLSILLATNRIELFPWKLHQQIDYQLIMDILQFDRNQDGTALLLARWTIMDDKGQPIITRKKSLVTAKPKGKDYESLVQALSETLANLSQEVAKTIRSLAKDK